MDAFSIDSSGIITIADPTQLAVGQTWTLTVTATNAGGQSGSGTMVIYVIAGATAGQYYFRHLMGV